MAKHTVTIVDDDAAFRESLAALLGTLGFETRSFASGLAFLEADQGARQGCVLLDYNLPDINGLEVLEAMHRRRLDTPVVLISGAAPTSIKRRATAKGAVAALDKPISGDQLLRTLELALRPS